MRKIRKFIVHCSDSPQGRGFTAEDVIHWHIDPKPKGNGWDHVGYHHIIEEDGTIVDTLPVRVTGYHVGGHNRDSVGVCLMGRDTFQPEQFLSLAELYIHYAAKYKDIQVFPHNHFNPDKTCPNFDPKAKIQEGLNYKLVLWDHADPMEGEFNV